MYNRRKREITRVMDDSFCTLEVELREDHEGREVLSICGSAGYVVDEETAQREALNYWISYFEECPEEMAAMGKRFGTCFCGDEEKAAQFVLDSDGEYHGLDVVYPRNVEGDVDPDAVFVVDCCGQIRDTIAVFHPEAEQFFPYHLNNMRPANGGRAWGYDPLPPHVILWALGMPQDQPLEDWAGGLEAMDNTPLAGNQD